MEVRAELWAYYKRKSDNKVPVRIRVNVGNTWKHVKGLAWYIDPKDWSDDFRMINPKLKHASKINSEINTAINRVRDYWRMNPYASIDTLINIPINKQSDELREIAGSAAEIPMLRWLDEFAERASKGKILISRTGKPISSGRRRSLVSTINLLREFNKFYSVNWESVNKEFYVEFLHFLRATKQFNESYVGKTIKNFKSLIERAQEDRDDGLYTIPEITSHKRSWFVAPTVESDKLALEREESQALMNADVDPGSKLERIRDRYTIAYNFLLRFSDSIQFDRESFAKIKGKIYYRYRSQKTGQLVEIPVRPAVWKLLEKYDFKLPEISNQKANENLKELALLATIRCPSLKEWFVEEQTVGGVRTKVKKRRYEWITTHTARRSGATDMDDAGVPVPIIMALGGWKTEAQLRTYIKRSARKMAERAAEHEFFQ